jgi:hypothetical protein
MILPGCKEKKLPILLKRLSLVIKALIEAIKMTRHDFLFSLADLGSKEGRRIFIWCIKRIPENFRRALDKYAKFTKASYEWSKVGKYKTKSFGEVDFSDIAEFWGVDIKHYKHQIHLHFNGGNINQKIIDACLHTINNYFEINSAVKKAILNAYQENNALHGFFKCCYHCFPRYESIRIFGIGEFKTINLENAVKKLKYPDLRFTVDNNNLTIDLCYHFKSASLPAASNALIVTMNEQLNILKFEHCEHLLS